MSNYWGYHLLVDAGGCNNSINNVEVVGKFVKELVELLEMYPIGGPHIVYVDTNEGKGVSAVQLITTSTITFHGDDEGKRVFIDIFSCKEYKQERAIALINKFFSPRTLNQRFLYRHAS